MLNSTEDRRLDTSRLNFCTTVPEQGLLENMIFSALNIFLSVTAILGNVSILVALKKESCLHPPTKLLFRCLASTDLCVGLIPQPLYVISLLALTNEYWNICYISFAFLSITGTMFSGVSLLTLTTISVDRLLALTLKLRYRQVVTLKRVRVVVVLWWIFSSFIALALAVSTSVAGRIVITVLFLCIVASSFCYLKLYHTLRHHQMQVVQGDVQHQDQPNGGGTGPLNKARYRKTVSTALWLQITLLACYLPYYTTTALAAGLLRFDKELSVATNVAFKLTITPVFLNSSLNPILYYCKIREVRLAVKDTVKQWCGSFPL